MKEIKSLTAIRGIAAVYVMIFHFCYGLFSRVPHAYFINTIIDHGYLAVDLFFFLSAFVMCLAYNNKFCDHVTGADYKQFMIKRFARIYPLYFVFCFVYFFLSKSPFFTLPLNLTLFQVFFDQVYYLSDVFWSLSTEWIMYFIFPFLFLIVSKWKTPAINIILLVILPLCLYLLKFVNYRVVTSEGITNLGFTTIGMARGFVAIIRCFIGYLIGISLFNLISNIDLAACKKYLHPAVLLVFVPFLFIKESNYFFLTFYIVLIASCYVNNERYSFINSGIIYDLGLWSYSIYVCHKAVKFVLIHFLSNSPASVASIIVSIVISYFTYTYIEKYFNKKLITALS